MIRVLENRDLEDENDAKLWYMWAYQYVRNDGKGFYYSKVGDRAWVELHDINQPIVQVEVKQDDNGIYYGWINSFERHPKMIWISKVQFELCFPYGYELEEKHGKGRMVRLSIREIV